MRLAISATVSKSPTRTRSSPRQWPMLSPRSKSVPAEAGTHAFRSVPAEAGTHAFRYVGSAFRRTLMAALVLTATALAVASIDAHKPITSPYTYNDDVFPIVRERCGQCHVQGGVAPMSLMT